MDLQTERLEILSGIGEGYQKVALRRTKALISLKRWTLCNLFALCFKTSFKHAPLLFIYYLLITCLLNIEHFSYYSQKPFFDYRLFETIHVVSG